MKVEHITLGGNSLIRETSEILPITRQKLSALQLSYESRILSIPALLPLKLKITATEEGAAFDVMKNDKLAVFNICCFEGVHTDSALMIIRSLADQYKTLGIPCSVLKPATPQWLYSVVIDPTALLPGEMITAGEVELYIYEQLYVSYFNRHAATDFQGTPPGIIIQPIVMPA